MSTCVLWLLDCNTRGVPRVRDSSNPAFVSCLRLFLALFVLLLLLKRRSGGSMFVYSSCTDLSPLCWSSSEACETEPCSNCC